jgi:RNA polymerase sigma-70 factor (sigma-E family)
MTDITDTHVRPGDARSGAGASRLEEAYLRNAPAALRFAYFLTGDREQAEDLVQEAFVRVAGRFGHLRMDDRFDAYLRRTIVNLFTSGLRRRRLERRWMEREAQPSARVTAPAADESAARDDVWVRLQALPARQRAAVVLRYYEDLSEEETATLLGCSVGAVNQLVVRATRTLRDDPMLRGDER